MTDPADQTTREESAMTDGRCTCDAEDKAFHDPRCAVWDALLTTAVEPPLTRENATARERLAHGRGLARKAIDGTHIPEREPSDG